MRYPLRRQRPPPLSAPPPPQLPSARWPARPSRSSIRKRTMRNSCYARCCRRSSMLVITLAAGYSVGSEFRRRDARAWLESAGGDPIVALVGKLAPLFGIFCLIMLAEALFLEGVLQIPFRGDVPLLVAAGP